MRDRVRERDGLGFERGAEKRERWNKERREMKGKERVEGGEKE